MSWSYAWCVLVYDGRARDLSLLILLVLFHRLESGLGGIRLLWRLLQTRAAKEREETSLWLLVVVNFIVACDGVCFLHHFGGELNQVRLCIGLPPLQSIFLYLHLDHLNVDLL